MRCTFGMIVEGLIQLVALQCDIESGLHLYPQLAARMSTY
jgi:hypothetical protein